MSYFYIDYSRDTLSRYDPSRFMRKHDDFYDINDSYLIEKVRELPHSGTYLIEVERRPDIYSNDIYGTTRNWQMLLDYNSIVLIDELVVGKQLRYPSLSSVEDIFFRLKTLGRTAT